MCVILQALKSSCKVLEKLSTKVLNPECWNSNLHCHIDVQPGAAPLTMITGVGEQTPGTCFWRWQTALSAHWYWLNPRRAARRHISNLSAAVRLFVFPTPPRLVQVCYGILLLQTHCWDLHGQIQWILTSHIFLSWLPQCNFLMSASQISLSCSLAASPHAMSACLLSAEIFCLGRFLERERLGGVAFSSTLPFCFICCHSVKAKGRKRLCIFLRHAESLWQCCTRSVP